LGVQTLDALLSPVSRAEFLSTHWNKSFLRLPGTPGRFGSLLSWDQLNRILEQHRLEPMRFSLVQNGKTLDASRYLLPESSGVRINAGGLTACLSQGATLVLDDVDEMVPAVRDLAESCEDALQSRVTVNLYGSWRTQKGFDLHWDTQDTMILQVAGRKQWKVYRPTRVHPLEPDLRDAPRPTDAEVEWEGVLDDGDVLYVPRGWWHVATPLDEPSLHLTVSIVPPHAIEFLHWLADQARDEAVVRMDVPRLADEQTRKAFVHGVSRAMAGAASPEALEQFLAFWDSRRRARPRLGLPDVTPLQRDLEPSTRLRLGQARRIAVTRRDEDGTVQLHANGHTWTGPAVLAPALQRLSATAAMTVGELCQSVPADAARSLRAMLTTLVMIGVVVIDAEPA
jgi:ribosomal protein L16 Arg81 hydroxylase